MSILVIGGGIAGIQASLELANRGLKVYLVEKKPSIGGVMAQLDKTFPTNDCSICIEAPKMVELSRHPNIVLLTNSEVKKVERNRNGKFRVKIEKRPRYINEDKCKACGACAEACLLKGKIQDEFNVGLSKRGAIYIPFPQAIPFKYTIDEEHCIFIRKGKCGDFPNCKKVCPTNAIEFEQEKEELEIEVASIIVAIGFELFQPFGLYGFGTFDNVITSLQFERLVNAAGPTKGKLVRLSDLKEPKSIAWIQCVGSRDKRFKEYCSQICCMYATKQALLSKEHNREIEAFIFYIDMRAFGKGFEEYYTRAKLNGINYIRARPSEIKEDIDKSLILFYEDTETGELQQLKVDLVVLSPAILPPKNNVEIARILGIKLDENGFLISDDEKGIYVCGCSSYPKDIPGSIIEASAAASKAAQLDKEREFTEPKFIEEKKIGEEVRIGVFICNCGTNIAGFLDIAKVTEYAATLPDVVIAEHIKFACSEDGLTRIKEAIKKLNLNRIAIAACTPRTHEPLFKTAIREAGLNKYLLEFVNIREQCSWVHMNEWEKATQKAKDLVRMGVAKARLLEPLKESESIVLPQALVIGGGLAGLTAAQTLANYEYKVIIVEKESELGGTLKRLNKLFPYDLDPREILEPLIKRVKSNKNIEIHVSTEVKEVKGHIGNFEVTLSNGDKYNVGVIIVATGFREIDGKGYLGYGEYSNIISMLELEEQLKKGTLPDLNGKKIVIINCVGAREENGRTYCCKIGCNNSVKNAKYIKGLYPEAMVYVLYQDMRMFGKTMEEYYKEAREKEVCFIRYTKDKLKIESKEGKLFLNVYDTLLQVELQIEVDLIVLTLATQGAEENIELMKILKVPLTRGNFFFEAHPKLMPLDFAKEGIYLCGCAHSPMGVEETILQAFASASRASIPLSRGKVTSEAITANVYETGCLNCGFCYNICPYGAIKLKTLNGRTTVEVDQIVCKGCGTCASGCLPLAIKINNFTNEQIIAQIRTAFEDSKVRPKILAFACNWCSYAGADLAGMSRIQYPTNVRIIRVMCSGRVDPLFVLEAFNSGIDGILISGCHIGDCHYINGNIIAELRYNSLKALLKYIGIEPERLRLEWISAPEGEKFAKVIREFTDQLIKIGKSI